MQKRRIIIFSFSIKLPKCFCFTPDYNLIQKTVLHFKFKEPIVYYFICLENVISFRSSIILPSPTR